MIDTKTTEQSKTETTNRPRTTTNTEAARYRRKLRDAEAERDRLADQLTTMRTREAERLATENKITGAALWAGGATLDDLLDDDGNVDAERVQVAADQAADRLGIDRRPRGPIAPSEGRTPKNQPQTSSWTSAFAPKS